MKATVMNRSQKNILNERNNTQNYIYHMVSLYKFQNQAKLAYTLKSEESAYLWK